LLKLCTFLRRWRLYRKLADQACKLSVFSGQFSAKTIDRVSVCGSWVKVVQDTADPDSCAVWIFQALAVAAD
jgi:hypothetical protein